ncbi:MAG: SGNH/GDSL hydrolase family protein [Muribaculaceae bacterium]
MKRISSILALAIVAIISLSAQEQKVKVSILGDSYSTFEGYVVEGNELWYGSSPQWDRGNDVVRVWDTWWHQLIDDNGLQLEVNDSWSGSTVCTTSYNGAYRPENAFVSKLRIERLGNPDVILVFGGTNDMWAGSPLGDYQYADWTEDDLRNFRPALCYLFDQLHKRYPNAIIYNIENTELRSEFYESCEVE